MHTDKLASVHLIELLIRKGIRDFIVSPGSRNAPLIMELSNRKNVNLYSITDERSAAFVAIGMYQKTGNPVAITCTSGSALLNYAPAVSEAFYQAIPLIVISADRPSFWIDKGEGQTIRQRKALANFVHCELNIELDSDLVDYSTLDQKIGECIDYSLGPIPGPVHINIEFEEPLYQKVDSHIDLEIKSFDALIKTEDKLDLSSFVSSISNSEKVMVLCGQMPPNKELSIALEKLAEKNQLVIITESTSNLHSSHFIPSIDKTLFTIEKRFRDFRPDILISLGDALVSKIVKRLLRDFPPREHWQISPNAIFRDTFKVLSHSIHTDPVAFIEAINSSISSTTSNYKVEWKAQYDKACSVYESFRSNMEFSDLKVFDLIINSVEKESDFHIANSSPIRYQQLFENKMINTYCNRGTSGIDGCSSTALGFSIKNNKETWLITGDISFLYDSNALWNSYKSNLKIILINNGGGGIFRILPGPKEIEDFETLIEANHNVDFESICKAFKVNYSFSNDTDSFKSALKELKEIDGPALLEVKTPRERNAIVLKNYFDLLKEE
jgi:2-succinyl-5-enolpyruvyl-6-hydroxy-3-cyclohexene-1-carboxylate synthase